MSMPYIQLIAQAKEKERESKTYVNQLYYLSIPSYSEVVDVISHYKRANACYT